MTRPTIVYVSGPMTTGNNFPVNIRRGIEAAVAIMERGYVALCPHEKALGMEMLAPRSYDAWMEYDYSCVRASDAVYRMPGESRGGDLEVAFAQKIGVPVYFSLDTLFACASPVQTITDPAVLWAAGLFEGEGTATINRARTAVAQLAITDEDVVRRFHTVVGVGNLNGPYQRSAKHKPVWQWTAYAQSARQVFELLLPHLGSRRRARVLEVLAKAANGRTSASAKRGWATRRAREAA